MDALKERSIDLSEYMPMTAYACQKAIMPEPIGECVSPKEEYKPAMMRLIRQMVKDAEGIDMPQESAQRFADHMVNSDRLFLWKHKEIVAMAVIVHQTEKYARINTVVTDREHRGKGYAKMLVGKISRMLLEKGVVPMLYADTRNPSSNRAYQKIGYEMAGEISEFAVSD